MPSTSPTCSSSAVRFGSVIRDGQESALGIAPARINENAATVVTAVKDKLAIAPEHRPQRGDHRQFDVAFSTHVQPLDEDLMQSAFSVDASGQRRGPLAWRGDGPGGHHRKGVLVFAPVEPQPATVELQIQRSGESVPRSFKWRLE